ncbi:hypothetical protein GCM10011452_09300 [Gemmobacter lanyuensis]|uniref:Uncharacterized protein n=1 Tax=Gemmobacter lanyuensis TaxID=1054497 RepID=A0A918INQ7_9RHOB|nr:hypothetical protein [Gemmobacter lanyuensis]GGW24038.1 hypothetical protein GCM10011452_09300 [Gemmobacter lanyuensis]
MMKNDNGEEVDLLGDPIRPLRDPRGRKSAVGNASIRKENQRVVMSLSAAGLKTDEIAQYMGIDAKTLRKYFSRELDHGAMLLEGLAMQALVQRMLEGNVSAAKEVRTIAAARAAPRTPKAHVHKPAPLGKKAALAQEAKAPPTGWGDLLN